MSKQSTQLRNIFNNTILDVTCRPEERFNDFIQVIDRDIKDRSQNILRHCVVGMQVERDPLTTIL